MGGPMHLDFASVKFVQAWHSSSVVENDTIIYTGTPVGVILKMGGKTIYHAGDTGIFYDMQVIGELNDIDIAILPIGGRFTMDVKEAALAAKWLNPGMVIPMHYNSFKAIEQDPKEFEDQIKKEGGIECVVIKAGEKHSL